jgi:hypothetical protein
MELNLWREALHPHRQVYAQGAAQLEALTAKD